MATTEHTGMLKTWKDDRGFGFIKPDDGSEDMFIHISALKGLNRRPYRGEIIIYQIETEGGKSKAVNARIKIAPDLTDEEQKKAEDFGNKSLLVILALTLMLTALYFFKMQ